MQKPDRPITCSASGLVRLLALLALASPLTGCAMLQDGWPSAGGTPAVVPNGDDRMGDRERIASLQREVERLQADLHQAEVAMLATDSEVCSRRDRASTVSLLAETRISIDKAALTVPWYPAAIDEARRELAEAVRQLEGGHPPGAVYFAARGRRIADTLVTEARRVRNSPKARLVKADRLNVRKGPSVDYPVQEVLTAGTPVFYERRAGKWAQIRTLPGQFGWVYASFLRRP